MNSKFEYRLKPALRLSIAGWFLLFFLFEVKGASVVEYAGLKFEIDNGQAKLMGFSAEGRADLIIPSAIEAEGSQIPVTAIYAKAFTGNKTIESVVIPSSVFTMERGCFLGCSAIKSVILEDAEQILNATYTSISGYSGYWFDAEDLYVYVGRPLMDMTLFGNKVTQIQFSPTLSKINKVFDHSSTLQTLYIPEGIISIEDLAFEVCASLREIHFPASLRLIGSDAFADCPAITDIYCQGEEPPSTKLLETNNPRFEFFEALATGRNRKDAQFRTPKPRLHVPPSAASAYSEIEPWCYFEILADNIPPSPTLTINVDISEGGNVEINGKPLENGENILEGEFLAEENAVDFIPDDGYEISSCQLLDNTGNILPAPLTHSAGVITLLERGNATFTARAQFTPKNDNGSKTTVPLKIVSPLAGTQTHQVPANRDYLLSFQPPQGYVLASADLDGEPIYAQAAPEGKLLTLPISDAPATLTMHLSINTGVETNQPSPLTFSVKNHILTVESEKLPPFIQIIHPSGFTRTFNTQDSNKYSMVLPSGIYLLKAGEQTVKVKV